MTEFSRIEIYNSYLFLRNALGVTNKKKDDSFLIGMRYTGVQLLALHIKKAVDVSTNPFVSETAFDALKSVINYCV